MAAAERRLEDALARQKAEFESSSSRQVAFIDRLLADKNVLNARCEELVAEVKAMEGRFGEKLRAAEEEKERELKKHKEAWSASEKIRRESWMAEKTKEIRETTIKGLQPEVERLMNKSKVDVRKAEERFDEELRRQKEQLLVAAEKSCGELRERLVRERDAAVEREREGWVEKLREAVERSEVQMQALRQRYASEMGEGGSDGGRRI